MNLQFTADGWDDYRWWQENDELVVRRINAVLADTLRNPFQGIGKPEPLKNELRGWWSRRITAEHRLVYRCTGTGDEQRIEVVQCRGHY